MTTITLNEEQERMLSEVVQSGTARSAQEAIDQALRSLHAASMEQASARRQIKSLAELFACSPFRGLDIEFERDRDSGRDLRW
jgi:Arc/MetJ-type ribon-helix-helix transcriptional regulator